MLYYRKRLITNSFTDCVHIRSSNEGEALHKILKSILKTQKIAPKND